jgi:hypothetical protein
LCLARRRNNAVERVQHLGDGPALESALSKCVFHNGQLEQFAVSFDVMINKKDHRITRFPGNSAVNFFCGAT